MPKGNWWTWWTNSKTTSASYPEMNQRASNSDKYGIFNGYTQGMEEWKVSTPPEPELPDEFDTLVEEIRKQNRLEELLKVIHDKVMENKLP